MTTTNVFNIQKQIELVSIKQYMLQSKNISQHLTGCM